MAVKTFSTFPDGYRLINGTKLNALFTGSQQMQAINVSGAATIGGLTTLSGGVTASGAQIQPATVVAAAGATAGGATAVPAGAINVWVSASASTEGIRLPTFASGRWLRVFPSATVGVKVYAHAGQVINALASTTAFALASAKGAVFYSADGTHLRALKGA